MPIAELESPPISGRALLQHFFMPSEYITILKIVTHTQKKPETLKYQLYNPWCVYSEVYAYSFVPPENWLKVSIRAGEKNYPLKSQGGVNNG